MLFRGASQFTLAIALAGSFACLRAPEIWASARAKQATTQSVVTGSGARAVGTIKAISGKSVTLTRDAGPDITVIAQDSTRFLRVAPGQSDLKDAVAIQLQDLQVGDRILVRGKISDDSKSVLATSIVVMKRSDVEAKHQREREDWQKRGLGGLVTAIDRAGGTITISTTAGGSTKTIPVRASRDIILRRYAPESIKFDDAKPGTLDEIKPGDQLRARGNRSADGSELIAEEIVSGSFRNIAGTITSVDVAGKTITVMDLIAKKPVIVKVSSESQLQKLPPDMGQRLAMRLKRPAGDQPANASGADAKLAPTTHSQQAQRAAEFPMKRGSTKSPSRSGLSQSTAASQPSQRAQQEQRPSELSGPSGGSNSGGGQPDLQQILNHVPAATLKDMQKGDAVMIVSTQGSASGEVTAITILAGVEPILASSPNGSQAMVLTPWSLGQGGDAAVGTP